MKAVEKLQILSPSVGVAEPLVGGSQTKFCALVWCKKKKKKKKNPSVVLRAKGEFSGA